MILTAKKWSVIREIRRKLKEEVKMELEEVFLNAGVDIELMEEFDINDCECEHPPYTPQCLLPCFQVDDHILFCLKTEEQVENFKKILLSLIERSSVILENFKSETIKKIEQYITDNLDEKYYPDGIWRETLKNFSSRERIISFEKSKLIFINKLKERKEKDEKWKEEDKKLKTKIEEEQKSFEEEQKTKREEKEKRRKKEDEELKIRSDVRQEINNKFSTETYNLDSNLWSPYSNWREKIRKIKIEELENFKNQMLVAIDKARENKQKENLHNIFEEAKKKTGSDLNESINNAEKERGSRAYEDNKEKVREMKEKRAAENPEAYRQAAQSRVRESMTKNDINEQDLADKEIKEALNKLNDSKTKEPSIIVWSEVTAIDGIEKAGVTKKLNQIITQIQQALKIGVKEDIEEARATVIEFINNSNFYYRFVYNKREPEIKTLLSKLENYSTSQQSTSENKFHLKVVLPIAATSFLIIGLGLFIIRQKSLKKVKNKNKKN